jgi:cyclic pyranopterin phosphate synthase
MYSPPHVRSATASLDRRQSFAASPRPGMTDAFGRRIDYLRLSLTDRCNLRCAYCLGAAASFVPKCQLLTFEELDRLCAVFVRLGMRKLRLTGGEPLVRKGVETLIARLGEHVAAGRLEELTLTTNGTRLAHHAAGLAAAGVRRVNVSLDTLDPAAFRAVTGQGDIGAVLEGIDAALAAGLAVKINAVAMRGITEPAIDGLIRWCGAKGLDLSLIELMPMGLGDDFTATRALPLDELRRAIAGRWTLLASDYRTSGPARYVTIAETGQRLGFITPLSHGFCATCNRLRVTAGGRLYTCLSQSAGVHLAPLLRGGATDDTLDTAIRVAVTHKPARHCFSSQTTTGETATGQATPPGRGMNVTGG